jgi:hypothetical protein
MTLLHLLIAAALIATTTVAVIAALKSYRKPWQQITAITLRILLAGTLLIAFFEPVLTVHRFPERTGALPVLIDASESMSFFDADSVLQAVRHSLDALSLPPNRKPVYLLFGDSVRTLPPALPYRTTDRTSTFPAPGEHPLLATARDLIIISDANWSNPETVVPNVNDQSIWYLPLTPVRTAPSLALTLPDSIVTPADSTTVFMIPCSGVARVSTAIVLSITEEEASVAADTHTVAAGPFHHTFQVRLPRTAAGLHRYRVSAVNPGDTTRYTAMVLRHVVPEKFTYTITSTAASLDQRFLRSALAGRKDFKKTSKSKTADIDFRFTAARPAASTATHTPLPVYLGTLPGGKQQSDTITPESIALTGTALHNPFRQLPIGNLPPVAVSRPGPSITVTTAWITAVKKHNDTTALVFRGVYRNKPLVGCALREFWRWDFLPLAHTAGGEADVFRFSGMLPDAAVATLLELQTDTLLALPRGRPIANRPIELIIAVPTATIPYLQPYTVHCALSTAGGNTAIDTAVTFIAGGSLLQKVTRPPLDTGTFTATCTLSTGSRHYRSAVTFTVEKNDAELRVTSQNKQLLNEMGQPLALSDTTLLTRIFTGKNGFQKQEPVAEKFRIRQSWWMLVLLLLLLGGEWLLRRLVRLD